MKAVCTGAGLAARAGILDGQQATSNKVAWKSQTVLGEKTHWVANARYVASYTVAAPLIVIKDGS